MNLWLSKLKAFSIHLGISLTVAALVALLVFFVWYPFPYREISGGRELFELIISVDVSLGPLITFVVFNPAKSRREKVLDFSLIGLIQVAALLYGLWTVSEARPVHMVFEYNRLRVVHATDIPPEQLKQAPAGIDPLPLTGPTLLSLRPMTANEQFELTVKALAGIPLAAQPVLWQSYEAGRAAILKEAKPLSELKTRFPAQSQIIDAAVRASGKPIDALAWLPMQSRKEFFWTAILDRQDARILTYLPIDSF